MQMAEEAPVVAPEVAPAKAREICLGPSRKALESQV